MQCPAAIAILKIKKKVKFKFSTFAEYKINTQKSVVCLYTNNKLSKREIKKKILFTIESKGIKYLQINFTKEMKDLYTENYKIMMKLKKTQINGKLFHAHGLEELIL